MLQCRAVWRGVVAMLRSFLQAEGGVNLQEQKAHLQFLAESPTHPLTHPLTHHAVMQGSVAR